MRYFKNDSRDTKSFKIMGRVYTMAPGEVIAAETKNCRACSGDGDTHAPKCVVGYLLHRTYGTWMVRATVEEYQKKPCSVSDAPSKSKWAAKPRPLGADTFDSPKVTIDEEPDTDEVSPAVVMAHAGIMGGR